MKKKLIAVGIALVGLGAVAGTAILEIDWGPPSYNGGYVVLSMSNTNVIEMGLRNDGVVVWRRKK